MKCINPWNPCSGRGARSLAPKTGPLVLGVAAKRRQRRRRRRKRPLLLHPRRCSLANKTPTKGNKKGIRRTCWGYVGTKRDM
jgi:hypothetical protein